MAEEYQYSPLPDKGYIRLLRILSLNVEKKTLRSRLMPCLLESCRPSTTLSHTWALPRGLEVNNEAQLDYGEEHTILCETASQGQERIIGALTVTENLSMHCFNLKPQ
jgi:hypothetical protein